ncbi:MAG: electron transfer flavoprotein subunit beta/FixA family protein [Bacteroidales bacterium]|nr:electron transfer flavoprotein subunit beta/FixA family protein [Bacteroidales bacterium]MCF8339179.1 electron transfer flavoprotein subunit beta/FixA family protein [Bacteroidales bacterium]
MNILVCISNVPDTTTKIRFKDNNTRFNDEGVQWIINPWDELALTRALELKEQTGKIDSITVLNVGEKVSDATLRKALAVGADKAIRIDAFPKDAFSVASEMAEYIKNESFDIILTGIESSDYNNSAVGSMLAELLGLPSVSSISSLNLEDDTVKLTREIEGGQETLTIPTPFVGIVQKGIAIEPRIPAMRGIMMARKKPLEVKNPVNTEPLVEYTSFELPPEKGECKIYDPENVEALIDDLDKEAKIL